MRRQFGREPTAEEVILAREAVIRRWDELMKDNELREYPGRIEEALRECVKRDEIDQLKGWLSNRKRRLPSPRIPLVVGMTVGALTFAAGMFAATIFLHGALR